MPTFCTMPSNPSIHMMLSNRLTIIHKKIQLISNTNKLSDDPIILWVQITNNCNISRVIISKINFNHLSQFQFDNTRNVSSSTQYMYPKQNNFILIQVNLKLIYQKKKVNLKLTLNIAPSFFYYITINVIVKEMVL